MGGLRITIQGSWDRELVYAWEHRHLMQQEKKHLTQASFADSTYECMPFCVSNLPWKEEVTAFQFNQCATSSFSGWLLLHLTILFSRKKKTPSMVSWCVKILMTQQMYYLRKIFVLLMQLLSLLFSTEITRRCCRKLRIWKLWLKGPFIVGRKLYISEKAKTTPHQTLLMAFLNEKHTISGFLHYGMPVVSKKSL